MTNHTVAVLPARSVGDPALDWGGRALCAESERGPALKSVTISRSLSLCKSFHPSQGSMLSGSLAPRSWLKQAFQRIHQASSSQGCLMSLRLASSQGVDK
ncbi:hypothetical protein [Ktedonobacter racemifer]|uniref:hypothetical protein n=1 Tax=Ktedonobacter racemifer TaxID=363277 RepID=UPI001B7FB2CE|nr:hypothetical protein [Ktedonobacter racemifer]